MKIDPTVLSFLKTIFVSRREQSSVKTITPDGDLGANLGAPGRRFDTIYARAIQASSIIGSGSATDADTVDSIHASATATPGYLFPLNGTGVYPASVYDQAVLLDGSRVMTAALSINPAAAGAPFTLGANAQGQLVTGLYADMLDVTVSAGAGLTGGGILTGNISLAVGAGDGISVSADAVSLASSVAGAGLAFASGVLSIGAGEGISVSADAVAIAWGTPTITTIQPDDVASAGSSTNPARSDHKHAIVAASPGSIAPDDTVAEGSATSFARSDHRHGILTGAPEANSVNISASTEGIGTTFSRSDHTHQLDQNIAPTWTNDHIFQGNITARHIMPQLTDTYDLGSSTMLWRKGWLSELDAIIFAQNTVTLLGGWLFITKGEGSVGQNVVVGATEIKLGDGASIALNDFILFRAAGKVEYMQVTAFVSGNTWIVTRNLDGSGENEWPEGTPYANLGYNGNGRIELNAYDSPRIQILTQGTSYNSQAEVARMGDLNGNWGYTASTWGAAFGVRTTSSVNITVDSTNGFRIFNSATQVARWYANGDMLIGQEAAGQSNLFLSSGTLQVRLNTTVLGSWSAAGAITVGQALPSQSNVYITAGDVQIRNNTTVLAEWDSSGGILIGQTSSNQDNIYISAGAISIRRETTERIGLSAAGILTIKNSSGNAVFTFNASAGAEFTLPLTIGASGGIYQGTGTFASPTTGLKLWSSSGIGRLAGYNAGTLQWSVDTDGKIKAGAGNVIIDVDGLSLAPDGTGATDSAHLKYRSGSTLFAELYLYQSGLGNSFRIYGYEDSVGVFDFPNGVEVYGGLYSAGVVNTGTSFQVDSVTGYIYVPLSTPYTDTAWDGDAFSTSGATTSLDLNTVFGLPTSAKAVAVQVMCRDSGTFGGGEYKFEFGPTTTWYYLHSVRPLGGDILASSFAIVMCPSQTIYYRVTASGSSTMDIWIRIVGYFI